MIYISTSCIKNNKIADILLELYNNGIKDIELSGGTKYYDGIVDDLLKYKNSINYVCHAYFPPPKCDFVINLASCNDDIYNKSIEFYKSTIELLSKLSIKTLSIHAGFYIDIDTSEIGKKITKFDVYNKEESDTRFVNAYKLLNDLCNSHGATLYLENNVISRDNFINFGNNDYLMLTNSDSIIKLYDELSFNFLLDFAHLNVSANTLGFNYESEVAKLSKIAKWYHLSENDGISDQHLPLQLESNILKVFKKYFNNSVPITLETKGAIVDILNSKHCVEKIYYES